MKGGIIFLNFITTDLVDEKAGIEQAIVNRIKLLKTLDGVKIKLITLSSNQTLHRTLANDDIHDNDSINLFDYFGNDLDVKLHPLDFDYIKEWCEQLKLNINQYDKDRASLVINQTAIAWLFFDPQGLLEQVDVYDQQGRVVKSELFDSRGFKSVDRFYSANNHQLIFERHYNHNRQSFIEHFFSRVGDEVKLTKIHLTWKKQLFQFTKQSDLWTFFLNCISQEQDNPIMFSERQEVTYPLLHAYHSMKKVLCLHGDHVNSHAINQQGDQEIIGSLNPNYEYALENLTHWDAVIMSTESQKRIFIKRFGEQVPVFAIPVGYITEIKPVAWNERHLNEIICVARLSAEKQHSQLIEAFKQVLDVIPQARLNLWGFDNGMKEKLIQLIKTLDLQDKVKLCGYQKNLNDIYNHANLSVLTSNNEGFNLALMESIAHGVPTIAYNAHYGAETMIDNGYNGYIVPLNNTAELAQKMIEILSNQEVAKKFSNNAYQKASEFDASTVSSKWIDFLVMLKEIG